MSLNNTSSDDADLKSRLAHYGIVNPITNTTRNILIKKLQKLEKESSNKQTTQSCSNNEIELMVI